MKTLPPYQLYGRRGVGIVPTIVPKENVSIICNVCGRLSRVSLRFTHQNVVSKVLGFDVVRLNNTNVLESVQFTFRNVDKIGN